MFDDDRALLDAFRAGERLALQRVFDAYVDDVAKLIRLGFTLESGVHILGTSGPDEQNDIIHDVFVRAFSKRARLGYDGIRPYGPYLMRIAQNLVIDRVRKVKRRPTHVGAGMEASDLDDLVSADAPAPEGEEDLDWKRQRAVASSYMESLPDELREFVRLRFVEGLPQIKVAKSLGITRRRVRTLERRALRGLLKLLQREKLL